MLDFSPEIMKQDIDEFLEIFERFTSSLSEDDWLTKTGDRDKDWTTHQVLAHLVAVAEAFNLGAEYAQMDSPPGMEGVEKRTDLAQWNKGQVEEGEVNPPRVLVERFKKALNQSAEIYSSQTDAQKLRTYLAPFYNPPSQAGEFINFQLSHAGIVHASQFTRGVKQPALWESYSAELTHRQIPRFIRHISFVYWTEFGDGLDTSLNFIVDGEQGGEWHLLANPDGGGAEEGLDPAAEFTLRYAEPGILFGLFTMHLSFMSVMKRGLFTVSGNKRKALKILGMFNATPPKR